MTYFIITRIHKRLHFYRTKKQLYRSNVFSQQTLLLFSCTSLSGLTTIEGEFEKWDYMRLLDIVLQMITSYIVFIEH